MENKVCDNNIENTKYFYNDGIHIEKDNHELVIKELRPLSNEDYIKEKSVGNYGTIISKKGKNYEWFDDGEYEEHIVTKYNIMLNDGSLVCEEWFDCYDVQLDGGCIIGYNRNQCELDGLLFNGYPKYESVIIEGYTCRYGAINTKGEYVIPAIYDKLTYSNNNSYIAYHNGKIGYVDSENGKQITPIVFSYAEPFNENGNAYVVYEDHILISKGYISRNTDEFNIYDWREINANNLNHNVKSKEKLDEDLLIERTKRLLRIKYFKN